MPTSLTPIPTILRFLAMAAVAAAAGWATILAVPDHDTPTGPSILLIVIDTLRADHLGLYGHGAATSPNLDRFAENAVIFENAMAPAPFTMPSVAAMMTGLYPDTAGVINHSERDGLRPNGPPTLAELATAAGYRTGAMVTNPWLANASTGFGRGFADYRTPRNVDRPTARRASGVTDEAIDLLHSFGDAPFLLWAHYLDPHMPYMPPLEHARRLGNSNASSAVVRDFVKKREQRQSIYFKGDYSPKTLKATRTLYDAEIRYVDEEVGRLLQALADAGRDEDTIVVLASDHGESLGDHGLYFAHDFTLYEELLHVALVVRRPATAPARISGPVSLVDVLPSICSWTPLRCPDSVQGIALPTSGTAVPRTIFAAGVPRRNRYPLAPRLSVPGPEGRWRAARRGTQKLIRIPGVDGEQWEAYDLANDPDESRNLWPNSAFDTLRDELTDWEQKMRELRRRLSGASAASVDNETRRQLQKLGYLD